MPRGRPPAGGTAPGAGHAPWGSHPSGLNKPKSKMTAYAFFVQCCRDEHKRKHPDEVVVFSDFARKCADRWKIMSEKEKKRFCEMAQEDKRRFDLEMQQYEEREHALTSMKAGALSMMMPPFGAGERRKPGRPPITDALTPTGRKKRKRRFKDPNAPKRCMSAFFWFSQEERSRVRSENPGLGVGDTAKELGRRWNEAPPELKEKFDVLAAKDRVRYDRDKREYQAKLTAGKLAASGVLGLAPSEASGPGTTNPALLPVESDDEDDLLEDEEAAVILEDEDEENSD